MALSKETPSNTTERDNYQRVNNVLKDGAALLLRDILTFKCGGPAGLQTRLGSQDVKNAMEQSANLFPEERRNLNPPSGGCVELYNFDTSLLIKVLRFVFFQDSPLFNGWNELPPDDDKSSAADLARIKYYRNKDAHLPGAELCDSEFDSIRKELTEAMVRLAGLIGPDYAQEFKTAIEKVFLSTGRKEVRIHISVANSALEFLKYHPPEKLDKFRRLRDSLRRLKGQQTTADGHASDDARADRDVSVLIDTVRTLNVSEGRVCEVENDGCDGGACGGTDQAAHSSVIQESLSNNPECNEEVSPKEVMEMIALMYLKHCPPNTEEQKIEFRNYLKEMWLIIIDEREGCLAIKVRCLSLTTLQTLWDRYKSGDLKDAAEQRLVTREILEGFGLERVMLNVKISEDEYKACRRELILRDLQLFDLNLIQKIEEKIDNGRLDDALTLIKESKPMHMAAEKIPPLIEKLLEEDKQRINLSSNKFGQSPLHIVAAQGNATAVRALLLHGANANMTDKYGRTPLHVASWHGYVDIVRELIDFRPDLDLNCEDMFRRTALNKATRKCHIGVRILLQQNGAKLSTQVPFRQVHTRRGLSELYDDLPNLHHAVDRCDGEEVVALLLDDGVPVDKKAANGETALHFACSMEGSELVELLLEFDANPNIKTKAGMTPLIFATFLNNASCVKLLLKSEADVDSQDGEGYTAMHVAAEKGHSNIIDQLFSGSRAPSLKYTNKEGFTPLHLAAEHGHSEAADILLKRGADPNSERKKETSLMEDHAAPLHLAAQYDRMKVVEVLLRAKADPNALTQGNVTPLHLAAQEGHTKVAEMLLKAGADPSAHTKQNLQERIFLVTGESERQGPIWVYLLAHKHRMDILKKEQSASEKVMLQDFGDVLLARIGESPPKSLKDEVHKKPWLYDKDDETALNIAVRKENVPMVQLLLDYHADVNASDAEGLTALHVAAINGTGEMVKLLIERGAEVDPEPASSINAPLLLAEMHGNKDAVSYLQAAMREPSAEVPKKQAPQLIVVDNHNEVKSDMEVLKNKDPVLSTKSLLANWQHPMLIRKVFSLKSEEKKQADKE